MKPRLLVIRGGAIGDFILTLPAIRLLRENFPAVHLEIIGYQNVLALADGRYYADAVRSIEYSAMASFFSPKAELPADLAEYFASFQQVVSFLYDPDGFFEGNLRRAGVKNLLSAFRKIDDSDHAARQWAAPLQSMALFLEEAGARVFPSVEDEAAAAKLLAPAEGRAVIALHPGSGSPRKNWPAEKWATVCRALIERAPGGNKLLLLISGGEADAEALGVMRQELAGLPVIWAENWPLPTLAAAFARCRLYLGHDSGISHLAAAVETPCLLLFGPTDPDIWAPANPQVAVITGGDDLAAYPVEAMLERALPMLPA